MSDGRSTAVPRPIRPGNAPRNPATRRRRPSALAPRARALVRTLLLVALPIATFLTATSVLPGYLASPVGSVVEDRLRSLPVADATARVLARYAQSDPRLFPSRLDYAWLPDELNVIRHGIAEISHRGARVEFGGGFHHFGYELTRDPAASTAGTNAWQLALYSEGRRTEPILTVVLPAAEQVDPPALLSQLTRSYERQLAVFPADERAHRGRIRAHLRFGQASRARQAVRDMRVHLPENSWATLLNALVDARDSGAAAADTAMEDYAQRHPDFFRHLDLAYYYQLTDRPGRAADAALRATAFDVNVAGDEQGDSEFRGYSIAAYLYAAGQYEVAATLCDRLQNAWINGDYAKPALRLLRAAAEEALQGRVHRVDWPAGMPRFQPFAELDLDRLLARPATAPRQAKAPAGR